ncbi:MAG: TIM barrel protein [Dehalococcoidia bacterium]|nr:TIM barrel protein [Dehalococcoidia bacterium]
MPITKKRGEIIDTKKGLVFGTAGIPHSTNSPHTAQAGITRIHGLGLGCMEMEFVQGVNMGEKTALAIGAAARNRGIRLTAHCPYYINLNSPEEEKVLASKERILQTARVASAFGADGVVFHAAFYMKTPLEEVYDKVKRHLIEIVDQLDKEKKRVWIRPEVMGKASQFGTLNEILRLSTEVEGVAPCIDFAHLHARTGNFNSHKEFSQVLYQVGEKLGRKGLDNLHLHISGIEYGDKGERKHLNLGESDFQYVELLQALKDHEAKGMVICESPNLEGDASLLQATYQTL